ncbi:MAG: hypothetical protein QXI11_07650 [Thermoproteota archaeon]
MIKCPACNHGQILIRDLSLVANSVVSCMECGASFRIKDLIRLAIKRSKCREQKETVLKSYKTLSSEIVTPTRHDKCVCESSESSKIVTPTVSQIKKQKIHVGWWTPRKETDKSRSYILPRYIKCSKCQRYFESVLPPLPPDAKHLENISLLCPDCTVRLRKRR